MNSPGNPEASRSRRLFLAVVVLAAIATVAVTALLINIFERRLGQLTLHGGPAPSHNPPNIESVARNADLVPGAAKERSSEVQESFCFYFIRT